MNRISEFAVFASVGVAVFLSGCDQPYATDTIATSTIATSTIATSTIATSTIATSKVQPIAAAVASDQVTATRTLRETIPEKRDPEGGSPSNTQSATPAEGASERASAAEETFLGKITSLGEQQFTLVSVEGTPEIRILVNEDTVFTLDGNEAAWGDVQVGQRVSVRAMDNHLALFVDAMSEK